MPNNVIKAELNVNDRIVKVLRINNSDFISLTDLARYANPEDPKIPVQTWMRNKNVISFLGLWEQLHNPNFKGIEFTTFESEAGKNSFYMSPQKWIMCSLFATRHITRNIGTLKNKYKKIGKTTKRY